MEEDDDQFVVNDGDDIDGGLFGSGSEDEVASIASQAKKRRRLDDAELDSGDDEGRNERIDERDSDREGEEIQQRDLKIFESSLGRLPTPRDSDGELYNLRFPDAVGINPKAFTLDGFEPPTTNHHSTGPPPPAFSAFTTSNTTIRFRHAPSDASLVQSNARILRWSDGSLTLQIASNPLQQYVLTAKPLAPPQINPEIPTPTSIKMPNVAPGTRNYTPSSDSHEYLAAPHEHAGLLRHTNHFTTALIVQSSEQDDEALLRLQESLAAATRGNKASADGGPEVISITEDPELAKKRAELAEKEKTKMQRRLHLQQERETSRANNVLRRSGLRTGGMGMGLTIGGLEDDGGMPSGRSRAAKPASKRTRRRNSEYSEDEDGYRGIGRTREDDYDVDDGFLVGSDEDIEVAEDDSEEEADLDAEGEDDEDEIEAPAKTDTDPAANSGRLKKKRIIEDEDEE